MGELRAGVAGAGAFGRHHLSKYASLPGVRLVAVYDHHRPHAEAAAAAHGIGAFDDLADFLDAVEAVTVATPADTHAEIALAALRAGRHAYVEKPLAVAGAAARALVGTARDKGLVLACGHQERVVFEAMGLFGAGARPSRIEAVRRGTPNPRNRDVSAVLDLMVHDLDLALALCGEAVGVEAKGGSDETVAEVTFDSGASGRFEVSRVAERRQRTMRLAYPTGVVEIDFLAPSFDNRAGLALNPDFAVTKAGADPLGTSVAAFVATARGEPGAQPVVAGEAGLRALELALRVEAAAGL